MAQHEAMYYIKLDEGGVRCMLCPHRCRLHAGQAGLCGVRVNEGDCLYSINYGEIASLALDPIEKKPLYHFYPATRILSVGTFGCNLFCPFCQNYTLAHAGRGQADSAPGDEHERDAGSVLASNELRVLPRPQTYAKSCEWLVDTALEARHDASIGVAFTYNEPTIWYEYVRETAEKIQGAGQKVVLVTNGYIEKKPLEALLPFVDAMNIDVKAFNENFYRRHCRGQLKAVMNTVEQAVSRCHVEITTLLIPEENNQTGEIDALARWLATLNPHIPLHFSRYHPAFLFQRQATSEYTMRQAREIAREHLNFVYLGNLPEEENATFCLNCGQLLIERQAYYTRPKGLKEGCCTRCGKMIDYIVS